MKHFIVYSFCIAIVAVSLSAQNCDSGSWKTLIPGHDVTCVSKTGTAPFGGFYEFKKTTPNGRTALIYSTMTASGARNSTIRSVTCRSGNQHVSISGTVKYNSSTDSFDGGFREIGYSDTVTCDQSPGGIAPIDNGIGVSGDIVSSVLRRDFKDDTIYPPGYFSPTWGPAGGPLDNKDILFSLSGSAFSQAFESTSLPSGNSCTTNISAITVNKPYESGAQVRGTVTGTTVEFVARLRIPTCGGDFEVEEHYVSDVNGPLKTVATTHRNIKPERDGYFHHKGSVPAREGESITLTKVRFRQISSCKTEQNRLSSVDWRLPLDYGNAVGEYDIGMLSLRADTITNAYDAAQMQFAFAPDSAPVVLTDSNQRIKQILTAYYLVNVEAVDLNNDLSDDGFTVTLYSVEDADFNVGLVEGIYQLKAGATFSEQYLFEDPDRGAPTGSLRTLVVSRFVDGNQSAASTATYTHDSATDEWTLALSGQDEILSLQESVAAPLRTELRTWSNQLGYTLRMEEIVYKTFTDNGVSIELPVEEKEWAEFDTSGAPLTSTLRSTAMEYYETGSHFGLPRSVEYPDGTWRRYTYDAQRRLATEVNGYLSNAITTADTVNRVTRYTRFSGVTLGSDTGDLEIRTELIANQITGQTMQLIVEEVDSATSDQIEKTITRRYLTPVAETTAGWNEGVYEESIGWTFASGPWENRLRRAVNSDGTETNVDYIQSFNFDVQEQVLLTKNWSGYYDSASSEFTKGLYTTKEESRNGALIERIVRDIASNLVIERQTYIAFDEEGRGTSAVFLDGTTEAREYGCCGLASITDRSGVTTDYEYDDFGERLGQTRDGIRSYDTESFDANTGFQLTTTRQDGRLGGTRIVEKAYRDGLGRLRMQYNALDHETLWSYSFDSEGGPVETVTYPNSGTRITTYFRDGRMRSVHGSAQAPMRYAYGTQSMTHDGNTFVATWEKQILLELSGDGSTYVDTNEFIQSFYDPLGRLVRVESPSATGSGLAVSQQFYDVDGLLQRSIDPHAITTLYSYDDLARPFRTAIDVNGNGLIDLFGTDRILEVEQSYVSVGNDVITGPAYKQVERVYTDAGTEERSLTLQALNNQSGFRSSYGNTTYSEVELDVPSIGQRTITTITNGLAIQILIYEGDRRVASKMTDADAHVIRDQTFDYDTYNRLADVIDARNGTTNYTYYADDRIHEITTPDPDTSASGSGLDEQVTMLSYSYPEDGGELMTTTFEDNSTRTEIYDFAGRLELSYGQSTYPQKLSYDSAGRLKTLTTWTDFDFESGVGASGAAMTKWSYNDAGRLEQKTYDDNSTLDYTYTTGGLLKTRTGGRRIVTTYDYAFEQSVSDTADLLAIRYSDCTPQVSLSDYDREGRPGAISDASGTRSLSYTQGQLTGNEYESGALADFDVSHTLDALGRPEFLRLHEDGARIHEQQYHYVSAQGQPSQRLQAIGWGDTVARYSFEPNSALLAGYTLGRHGYDAYTQSKAFDRLNRLRQISTSHFRFSASYDYQYNDLNQRTRRTRVDGSYESWSYDLLGQLDGETKHFNDDSIQPGGSLGYNLDHIGNRIDATRNGISADYTLDTDGLNQYDKRHMPRSQPVYGEVNPNLAIDVSVNGTAATLERGRFYAEADLAPPEYNYPVDSDSARFQAVDIEASKSGGEPSEVARYSKDVYLPPHPQPFTHDADGNLKSDGQWSYTWDAENRLIELETLEIAYTTGAPREKLEFAYDSQGRRFSKKVYEWDGTSGTYLLTSSFLYIYDGWNLIAELDAFQTSNLMLQTAYVWGLDLSGSLQGAGGVGGLLAVKDSAGSTFYPAYDGNGNVMGYYAADTGENVAEFEYGPFGELLKATGSKKDAFNFRFSTKYLDTESEKYYYGYRYYDADTGRWLSRDPIGENGGLNLYGFIGNDGINDIDLLGAVSRDKMLAIQAQKQAEEARRIRNANNKRIDQFYQNPPSDGRSPLVCDCSYLKELIGYARISAAVYSGSEPQGFKLKDSFIDPVSGFKARIYESTDGRRIGAFAGTEPERGDIEADAQQGAGQFYTPQYAFASEFGAEYRGQIDIYVGHSLGGGLAHTAGGSSSTPSITFNSAALHPNTIAAYGGARPWVYPTNITLKNDLLTLFNQSKLTISRISESGNTYVIPNSRERGRLEPNTLFNAKMHGSLNVVNALEQLYQRRCK